ncbi:MAG TPA: HYR domain-containing protein, partial [Solirubrobacteraceae bacterium]|nr:HYR domain-containing protein [Solirubrobacteraceae bacterium]
MNEVEESRIDAGDPRNRRSRFTDKNEATAQARAAHRYPGTPPHWTAVSCPDEADGGCSGAESRSFASVDLQAGLLETYALGSVHLGHRPFEVSATSTATAFLDDTITVSKPTAITLRGRVRGTADEGWPLRVKLLVQRYDPANECSPEVCGEPLEGVDASSAGPAIDEHFAIPVSLPAAGTYPFNAEVVAEVGPMLLEGSTFAHADARIANAGDSGVSFRIEVPGDVTVSSGSGKLPVDGGATTPGDTTPPVLDVPGLQVVDATAPSGATVGYSVRATDDSGQDPAVQCDRASGTVFPIGLTRVACTATDAAGNAGTASFDVRVTSAAEQLDALIARVTRLPDSVRAPLVAVISAAPKPIRCAGLRTFAGLVDALRARGRIPA